MQHPDHFHLIPFAKVEYPVILTDQEPIIGMDGDNGIQWCAFPRHVPEAFDAGAEQLEDTHAIIPKKYMQIVQFAGTARFLFVGWHD